MQPILSQKEENERTKTQSDIPQQDLQHSSPQVPIAQTTRTVGENGIDQPTDQAHVSAAINENNKRPRPDSFVAPTSSVLETAGSSLILGPTISSNLGTATNFTSIPPVVIEGSQPKRAMSEEHLSGRSDSPVVNLPNGQANLANNGITTGNTKLSEVTYPAEPVESEDVDMKAESSQQASEEVISTVIPEVVATPVTLNKGMKPEDRPSLPEQVRVIRCKFVGFITGTALV